MRYLLILLFFTTTTIIYAQDECDSEMIEFRLKDLKTYQFLGDDERLSLCYLTPEEFDLKTKKATSIKDHQAGLSVNTDSLELQMLKSYPQLFKKTNSCIILLADTARVYEDSIQLRKVCNIDFNEDRGGSTYSFEAVNNNHASVFTMGYEIWGYRNINLITGKSFETLGFPIFLSNTYVFNIGNYYGAMELEFIDFDTGTKSRGVLEAFEQKILFDERAVYVVFKTNTPRCDIQTHYLEVQFSNEE